MMSQIYDEYFRVHEKFLEAGYSPLEVAATLIAHGLIIYRTILEEDEYQKIVNHISESRDAVPIINENTTTLQ